MNNVEEIPLDCLVLGVAQVRLRGVEADLDELTESIRIHGLLEPIVVSPHLEPGKFEVVSGQRRYLAHKKLGRATIPAIVMPTVDEMTAKVLSLTENVIRRDLDSKDLVDVCTSLFRKYGTAQAVAEETGIPYSKVLKYVKYERLSSELRLLFDKGQISLDVALTAQDLAGRQGRSEVDGTDAGVIALELSSLPATTLREVKRRLAKGSQTKDVMDVIGDLKKGREPSTTSAMTPRLVLELSREELNALTEHAKRRGISVPEAARRLIEKGFKASRPRRAATRRNGALVSTNGATRTS
jgi:ParB family chromosome partitioning protein